MINNQENIVVDNLYTNYSETKNKYFYLAILIFLNLLNYADRYTVAGSLIDIQRFFKIDDAKAGFIVTVFICCYMIAAPLFGYLGDRYSRKLIICIGLSIWILAVLFSSYSQNFFVFLIFRALVGIGEAAFSTVAPTIISDLFNGVALSQCLMIFYAASPVGSGFGYIIGSSFTNWRWGIRVTPLIGVFFIIIIIKFFKEPVHNYVNIHRTSFYQDVLDLCKIRTYLFTTLGFTCITFVLGSLSWWAPTFVKYAWNVINGNIDIPSSIKTSISVTFGILSCIAGIIGVLLGSTFFSFFKNGLYNSSYPLNLLNFDGRGEKAGPLVCAFGALFGVLALWFASFTISKAMIIGWIFIFIAVVLICLGLAITTEIILYVTPSNRHSTAIAIQTLFSHLLGDAASPYVIGLLSDIFRNGARHPTDHFIALQYAFFIPNFILILAAVFYIKASKFIEKDSYKDDTIEYKIETLVENDGELT